ncbi:hydrogenase nickel incorporation protein HypB [Streptomyces sp. SID10815]|uniref:hydrogenase nickel incorporation protein HypB n=1 Tax=Streptomyces sp. SID10815 TaxID=2706027 RepID=UPI0013CB8B7D|nr:hydrogenase nickel incorporation protein HypB [Streptomyces sp. SID10815]NEA49074.1 hydrogenase nickel incorporation protein HypB [Streptomyces sp. SID10815]
MCRSVDVQQAVLAKNDDLADALREELTRRGVTVVNLLSSPGSGKTELLGRVLARAVERGVPVAALTADLATENDARRLARSGAPVRQVLTDGLCHLEARQVRRRLEGWLPADTAVLFVENVGNLVCPASYDLGERLRIVLMAVTEGEDKPLKYPTAFGSAHLVVTTKTDLAGPAGFDEAAFRANVRRVNPGVEIVRTCARTGDGVDTVLERALATRHAPPAHRPPLAPRPHDHGHTHDTPHGDTHTHGHTHTHEHGHTHGHEHDDARPHPEHPGHPARDGAPGHPHPAPAGTPTPAS